MLSSALTASLNGGIRELMNKLLRIRMTCFQLCRGTDSLPHRTRKRTTVASCALKFLPNLTASSLTITLFSPACTSVFREVLGGLSVSRVLMEARQKIIRSKASVKPYLAAICAHWSNPITTREYTASSEADMKTYDKVDTTGLQVASNISASKILVSPTINSPAVEDLSRSSFQAKSKAC